jgi:lipoic acid synthetase
VTLHVRWLGAVAYRDGHALQRGLLEQGADDWLLLLEHPHTFTLGRHADAANVLVDPSSVGAEAIRVDRGGDVTYHGPGQLTGYPILTVPPKGGGTKPDTTAFVHGVEQLLIDAVADLGLPDADRLPGYPGVWVGVDGPDPRKIAAIGTRITRGRSMHGFALNVDPDLDYFGHIVPCGIPDKAVTSLRAEGIDASMHDVVDAVAARAVARWGSGSGSGVASAAGRRSRPDDRADVVWRHRPEDLAPFSRGEGAGVLAGAAPAVASDPAGAAGTSVRLRGRLAEAGVVQGLAIGERKPAWMRAPVRMGADVLGLRRTMRDLDLVTVCEEAGCPNLSECWADGTATFMINGERCTRACGFCLVDTRHPDPVDATEPARLAEAVERMGLSFAVVTAVARDDLPDGGAAGFAAVIEAIRARTPGVSVEVLIPDCKGDPDALDAIFDARPDVLNHNLETVARLQRAVRPSASYARSLAVLARAKRAGLVTKSGLIVGMGETDDEVLAALADLRGVGVDIVTIGQYLRPTSHHLAVQRWVTPERFAAYRAAGEALGIGHVESSPLTRSSYHARQAASAPVAAAVPVTAS